MFTFYLNSVQTMVAGKNSLFLNQVIRKTTQEGASKGLLDVIASSKDDDPPSKLLLTALGSEMEKGTLTADNAFKLPDLVTQEVTKEGEAELL